MKKLKWIIPILLVLIVGCGLAVHLTFTTAVNTNIVFIREITFSDKLLLLSGDFSSSAMDYKGYSLRYDNHKLYVKIKGSVLTLGKREGAFRFTVDTKQYGSIQEIYLQDDSSQRKIWPQ